MNNNIPKSNLRNSNRSTVQNQLNTKSLNISSVDCKSLSKERQKKGYTISVSTKNKDSQSILCGKYERENSRSNESLKQNSVKSKKSKKTVSSLNSSKLHSQGTLENIVNESNIIHNSTSKNFHSISNIGDITANFNSLQHSSRYPNIQQQIQPFQTNQGPRSNSQGNIINIQTPENALNQINHQSINQSYLQLPGHNIILSGYGTTDRSASSIGTDYSRRGPITATIINPSASSLPGSTLNSRINQYQRPQNFSISQQISYSPVHNQLSNSKSSMHQTVSPAKFIQANPLSFQNTGVTQLVIQNHGSFMLQKLELFWKDRLLKLNQCIQQVRENAYDSDDIIKTMLENQETIDYADQRINELIKEGINIEQELQIEQLSKQLIAYQTETLQVISQRDSVSSDYQLLFQDHQVFKSDMEIIVTDLKNKKQKYKTQIKSIDETKTELKQVKDERDVLLEKLKIFQNLNSEKQHSAEQKVEDIQNMLKDLEDQKESLIENINKLKEDKQQGDKLQALELQNLVNNHQEQLKDQKKELKAKYLTKLNEVQFQLQNDLQLQLRGIQQTSETKIQSQSKLDQQNIDFLQSELSRLKLQLQNSLSVIEHETILNQHLNQLQTQHESEINAIKQAFEGELRKAEKQVRQNLKKEEIKLLQSVTNYEKNIDQAKSEKISMEKRMFEEIQIREAQLNKLRELINDKDKEHNKELNKHKDRIKSYEVHIQQFDIKKKDELESIKIEITKNQISQTFILNEQQQTIKMLEKDVDKISLQLEQKEFIIRDKELQYGQLQKQFLQLENEFNDYQKKQMDKSSKFNDKADEVNILNQQVIILKMKLKEQQTQFVWKLERELERTKRVKQEIELLKKLLKSDMEFATRDCQTMINQTLQIVLKKYDKMQSTIKINQQMIAVEDYLKVKDQNQLMEKENQNAQQLIQRLEKEQEEQQKRYVQDLQILKDHLSTNEQQYKDEINRLEIIINGERSESNRNYQQLSEYTDELEQLRSENATLHQKMGELDTLFQEIDFKLKNTENERDLFQQQLQFEEKSKHEESSLLRQQFQSKQDQLIADFKEQCLKLRSEIEETYNNKLKNKITTLKVKHQEEIQDINNRLLYREQEIQEKIEIQQLNYENQIQSQQVEINRLKKDLKKIMLKYKTQQRKDQENISKIEEEVVKSLAKVNSSVGSINRKQVNHSFMSNNKHSSMKADRSFQNIANHSMFKNVQSRDNSDFLRSNLTLQSLRNNNNQSFQSINGNQSYISHQPYVQHSDQPQSTRNNYNQQNYKSSGIHNNLMLDTQSTHQSLILQELNSNQNNQRRISPISKSLNHTDISNNSSFIAVSQSQGQWPRVNQNQVLCMEDSQTNHKNRLQESSMNRVLNVSGDMQIGSNVSNNDSFLVARSLSPKEKTGKFGNKLMLNMNSVNKKDQ